MFSNLDYLFFTCISFFLSFFLNFFLSFFLSLFLSLSLSFFLSFFLSIFLFYLIFNTTFQSMMFRSFLDYQEELELRVPAHSDNIFAALPRKYRCSGRVGRGGRIVVDRFPVKNISALTCIFFFRICFCLFSFYM